MENNLSIECLVGEHYYAEHLVSIDDNGVRLIPCLNCSHKKIDTSVENCGEVPNDPSENDKT